MTEKANATLPGTVQKIIKSPDPRDPEKAEIAVEGADELYREIRIENTLTDEKGNQVKLKEGAHGDVTVVAEPDAATSKSKEKAKGESQPGRTGTVGFDRPSL